MPSSLICPPPGRISMRFRLGQQKRRGEVEKNLRQIPFRRQRQTTHTTQRRPAPGRGYGRIVARGCHADTHAHMRSRTASGLGYEGWIIAHGCADQYLGLRVRSLQASAKRGAGAARGTARGAHASAGRARHVNAAGAQICVCMSTWRAARALAASRYIGSDAWVSLTRGPLHPRNEHDDTADGAGVQAVRKQQI